MTSVYELSNGPGTSPAKSTELPPHWLTDGVARWVRMADAPQHELEATLRVLDLPDGFLKTPQDIDTQPRVGVHGPMVLVVMPVLNPGESRVGVLR